MDEISIYSSLKFPLKTLQIFGFFPVRGLSGPNSKSLKFSWISFIFFYSVFCLCVLIFFLMVLLYEVIFISKSSKQTTNLIFYASATATNIFFLDVAKNWPSLCFEWNAVESIMGSITIRQNLKKKLKILTLIFLIIASVEHILIQCHLIILFFRSSDSLQIALKKFYKTIYFQIFSVIDYSLGKALLIHILTLRCTFSWTFIDVFIILISTSFVFRLKQLNAKVDLLLKVKVKNTKLWKQLRYEHFRLYQLGALIDNKLSYIIIVSYATNLYFILIQLYESMNMTRNTLRTVYYFISFALLIMRLVCVCLSGASVHDESRNILPLLCSVSSSSYNSEIEKFVDQVVKNEIVITGKNFFKITKGLILKFAGAILTYELVILQFNLRLTGDDENEVQTSI